MTLLPSEQRERLMSGIGLAKAGCIVGVIANLLLAAAEGSPLYIFLALACLLPLPLLGTLRDVFATSHPSAFAAQRARATRPEVVQEAREEDPVQTVVSEPVSSSTYVAPADTFVGASTPAPERAALLANVDWEEWVGQKLLQKLGIVVMLLGCLVFLKYSFDNRWIGELGRVALGVLAAIALLVVGEWKHRLYPAWAQGFTGGGLTLLTLCVWVAHVFYRRELLAAHGIELATWFAFALYVAITAVGVLAAVRYRSATIAWFALVGGFLTPHLLAAPDASPLVLASYLLVLSGGLLTLWWWADWKHLAGGAFFFLQLSLFGFVYPAPLEQVPALAQVLIASLAFALFNALPVVAQLRRGRLTTSGDLFLMVLNGLAVFIAVVQALGGYASPWTFIVCLLLAAVYVVSSALALQRCARDASLVHANLLAAIGLVALACLHQLTWDWVALAWAPLSAALLLLALRVQRASPIWAGMLLLVGSLLSLVTSLPTIQQPEVVWSPLISHWSLLSYVIGGSLVAWIFFLPRLPERLLASLDRSFGLSWLHGVLAAVAFLTVTFEVTQLSLVPTLPLTLAYVVFAALALGVFWITRAFPWFVVAVLVQGLVLLFTFVSGEGSTLLPFGAAQSLPLLHFWVLPSVLSAGVTLLLLFVARRTPVTASSDLRTLLTTALLAQLWVHLSVEVRHLAGTLQWSDVSEWRALMLLWVAYAASMLAVAERWQKPGLRRWGCLLLVPPFLVAVGHLLNLWSPVWFERGIWAIVPLTLLVVGQRRRVLLFEQWAMWFLLLFAGGDFLQQVGGNTTLLHTLWWAAVASTCLGFGFYEDSARLRRLGIMLFAAVTLKLLLVDASALEPLARTVASMVTGLAMIGASYFYQRAARRLSSTHSS
jgi:hypothetical protein